MNGATIGVAEAVALLGEVSGISIEPRYVPMPVASVLGRPLALVAELVPGETPLCREMVRTLLHGHRYDGSRIERELGSEVHAAGRHAGTHRRLVSQPRAGRR